MARTVREFEATGKITPTDRGFSAMEQAGRRVGPFFTQMAAGAREVARLTQQIDDEFGKGLKNVADEQGRQTTAFLRFSGLEQQDAQRIQEAVLRANEQRGGGGGGGGVKVRGFESDPFGMFNKSWGNASELSNGGPLLSHLARQHMQRTSQVAGPKNDTEGSGNTAVLRGGAAAPGSGVDVLSGRSEADAGGPSTVLRGGQPVPGGLSPFQQILASQGIDPNSVNLPTGTAHAPSDATNPLWKFATASERMRMMGYDPEKKGEPIGEPNINPQITTIGTPYRSAYQISQSTQDIGPQGAAISDKTPNVVQRAIDQKYGGATSIETSPLTQFEAERGFSTAGGTAVSDQGGPSLGETTTEKSYYSPENNYGIQPTTQQWNSSAPIATPTPTDTSTVSPSSDGGSGVWSDIVGGL